MRVKLFTFRYSTTLGGFDDRPLCEFVRDKEVLSFREHFFCVNDVPHLVCLLSWQEALVSSHASSAQTHSRPQPVTDRAPIPPPREDDRRHRTRGRAPDPTAGLDETQRLLFNSLREWRAGKARDDGVPPYLVFTNRHLVELVTTVPDSPTALMNLHGVGPAKVERYGAEVLALLGTAPEPGTAESEAASAESGSASIEPEPAATESAPATVEVEA